MRDYNTMYREQQAGESSKDYGTIRLEAIRDQGYWLGDARKAPAAPAPAPAPAKAKAASPRAAAATKIPDMPTLDTPDFELPEGATVKGQLDEILGTDSKLMQRAKTLGNQQAASMGQNRGSMSAGHATNAMLDVAIPIGLSDANTARDVALTKWKVKVDSDVLEYNKLWDERLAAQGYAEATRLKMIEANTALTQSLMNNATSLLSNPNIANSGSVVDWLTTNVMIPGQDSNNAFGGNLYFF